ncbi:MAG: hypothetical protein R3A47_04820 [Polyangiales bacterium]
MDRGGYAVVGLLCLGLALGPNGARAEDNDIQQGAHESIYHRKVKGVFWIEGTVGPSQYDLNRFASRIKVSVPSSTGQTDLNLGTVKLNGLQYGGALGLKTGPLMLGIRYKTADYDTFSLNTASLDFQFLIRTPYVHPMIRFALNYHWVDGQKLGIAIYDENLLNSKVNGGGATLGAGLRIPIIRYLSLAAAVDFSGIGLYVRGDSSAGIRIQGGLAGLQIAGTFALTLHI